MYKNNPTIDALFRTNNVRPVAAVRLKLGDSHGFFHQKWRCEKGVNPKNAGLFTGVKPQERWFHQEWEIESRKIGFFHDHQQGLGLNRET